MPEKIKFLDVFPCCTVCKDYCGGLAEAYLNHADVSRQTRTMVIDAFFPQAPAPVELGEIEKRIKNAFSLSNIELYFDYPRPEEEAEKGKFRPEILLGNFIRKKPVPMSGLNQESGFVAVSGKVFLTDSREVKNNGYVLSFSLTDGLGSVHVSKYLREGDDRDFARKIKDGMFLTIAGNMQYNRYDQDISLDPKHIQTAEAPETRPDTATEKRVELHLHTRFSNMDALSDPADVVKRAEKWGHSAVAITDHGVVQAFPDAWHADEKSKCKVIYGMEGYYINDVDERMALSGCTDLPLNSDFIAFDLETTGLHSDRNRIIEIGAVRFSGGKEQAFFNTMVDPHTPLTSEIIKLTGITDHDVIGAPDESEALKAFFEFAGDLPLVAHNADFDVSFLRAASARCGFPFEPVYLDTLVLSQALLPHLKRHKLDAVSDFLGLPEFNHHRASDDALVAGRIMQRFVEMLQERGVTKISGIDPVLQEVRKQDGVHSQKAKHIILLAMNKTGLKNLYQMVSYSFLENYHKNPILPKSLIQQHREGLLIGSACVSGELFQAILHGSSDSELCRIASFYDYLEIQPICNNHFLIETGKAVDEEALRNYNRKIVEIGKKIGRPVAATGDVHFLNPEDEIYRKILLAGKKYSDADKPMPIYFRTTDEMLEEFSYLGEDDCYDVVIRVPNMIADRCEKIELLPHGQLFPPEIQNSAQILKDLVYGRLHELYGDNPPSLVTERVETELDAILGRNYDVIYMSAQKLVADSLEHNYLVGSRGSVGSSIVAYLSGITEVNSLPAHYRCPKCCETDFESGEGYGCGADMPDKICPKCGTKMKKEGFDIPFETFLGFGGDKVPDIDLNFSGEYQANAHKYTETLFGSDHVFRAGTIGTLAQKTAYGYVKKYLEERGRTVTKAEESRLSLGCVGVKRTTGQHPGGLVIIPQDMDVNDFCPVQHPADDPTKGIITTHFEYHCMEDNLLKLDELGHDDPTMIRMLEDMTGVNAKTDIELDDKETMEIFRSPAPLGLPDDDPIIGQTGTIGIPEFGTGFTRQMLVDTKPEGFDILVRLSGFSHGTDVWLGNAKDLITSGKATVRETVGCRDDIMLYLISKGMDPKMAFKIMEAVRKGKVKKGGFQEGWVEKMNELEVPKWYIESLAKIAYLFPKAHAVAYVMMAFRIAWFKVHRAIYFYSAYFYRRSQKNSFDAQTMTQGIDIVRKRIDEITKAEKTTANEQDLLTTYEAVYEFYMRGFSFAPIDIYESDAAKFIVTPNELQLRPPFISVSGLGEAAAADLAECGHSGREFVSVEEISDVCSKVSQTHFEILKNLGAFRDLSDESQMSLF